MITPPVALAVYAATSIAESDYWKTAFHALTLGISAFIVPFMFVYNPSLLWIGSPLTIAVTGITAMLGAILLGSGLSGWFLAEANAVERILLIASGFLLIDPAALTNYLGLAGLAVVLIMQRKKKPQETLKAQ